MKIAKWGNSLAVRLPSDLVKELGLVEGDEVEVAKTENGVELQKVRKRDPWAKSRRLIGTVPSDFKFDREEANER